MGRFALVCILIHSLAFEAMVWGGWYWIVFELNRSPWWTAVAMIISAFLAPKFSWKSTE